MITPKKLKIYSLSNIDSIPQIKILNKDELFALKVISRVLPFRTNNYVLEELVNWDNIPDDPIYILNFMQKGMLKNHHFEQMANAVIKNDDKDIENTVNRIRNELNPNPAGQSKLNIPTLNNEPVSGLQHKYRETVLVFPSSGQTCHAYCTFCFRWSQFVKSDETKFSTCIKNDFFSYLLEHKEVTDVLFTGGDPMIMGVKNLKKYLLPLLAPEYSHIQSIRIGTKSLSYWPYRFVTDSDADEILSLFKQVKSSGKNISIMANFSHYVELTTEIVKEAISRILSTGTQIRTQSPLLKNINDKPIIWEKMWKEQVELGCIPYYMFVERNTGSKNYFEIPLIQAYNTYRNAIIKTSGLSRTARGPVMSSLPGKVLINGIMEIRGEKVFQLMLIQGRNPEWCFKPFFAKYDPTATWLNELKPALGEKKFFYQDELDKMIYDSGNYEMTNNKRLFNSQLRFNYN